MSDHDWMGELGRSGKPRAVEKGNAYLLGGIIGFGTTFAYYGFQPEAIGYALGAAVVGAIVTWNLGD